MITQLFVATLMVGLTVIFHGIGISWLSRFLRFSMSPESQRDADDHSLPLRAIFLVVGIVLALFVLHGIEIWTYAGLYLALGAVGDLETAVYFSTITYAAIGYSDSYFDPAWRLVSAIEGINGLILLGWSTAFFVTVIARLRR